MIVEIWSDISCPFCFLGKVKFEKAVKELNYQGNIEVIWKSFQLNPSLITDEAISIYDYLSKIKGFSVDQAKKMNSGLSNHANEYGVELNFDKVIVANTFKGHILLQYAKKFGKQNEMKSKLVKAYFTDGINVDNLENLIAIADEIGIKVNDEIFTDSELINMVNFDLQEASEFGIQGVPFFVFNRKYAVSGAQDVDIFKQTLEKSYSEYIN